MGTLPALPAEGVGRSACGGVVPAGAGTWYLSEAASPTAGLVAAGLSACTFGLYLGYEAFFMAF